jgi:hypothetical protein
MNIYREISVWDRTADGRIVCYRCLELLPSGGFCVQSADFYSHGADCYTHHQLFFRQFIELLLEEPPEKRSKVFSTLYEAIENHNREFGE